MSIVVMELASRSNTLSESIATRVKEILAEISLPKRITGIVVEKYIRKAMRLGIWRRLSIETRALLLALRRWGSVKSPTLLSILRRVFLEIELCTFRGKALFFGILLSLKNSMNRLQNLVKSVAKILILGISYLNNPPIYRVYG